MTKTKNKIFHEKNAELFLRLSETEDKNEKELIIDEIAELNYNFALKLSHKYIGTCRLDTDEIISASMLGLTKAIKSFKLEKGYLFSTYAGMCIENAIRMDLRVAITRGKLKPASMELPIGNDGKNELYLKDIVVSSDDIQENIERGDTAKELMEIAEKILSERDLIIFKNYLLPADEKMLNRHLAKKMGLSQPQVSRISAKACKTIKNYFNEKMSVV